MNSVPLELGETVILVCSYRGGVRRQTPFSFGHWRIRRLVDVFTLRSLRSYVATWRDYHANPRSPALQRQLAEAVAARSAPNSRIIVDAALPAEAVPQTDIEETRIARLDLGSMELSTLSYAPTVVLVYPDPLGLSWGALESKIAKQGRRIFIVNGRRRLFLLDGPARRALAWRRFLANTRIAELALGILLVPISGLLALKDRMSGRT